MLVNPELLAWLGRQTKTELEKSKGRPLVTRSENAARAGSENHSSSGAENENHKERADDVEYLNARSSNLNFYA